MCRENNKQLLKSNPHPSVWDEHKEIVDFRGSFDIPNDVDDDLGIYSFGELIAYSDEDTVSNIIMDDYDEPQNQVNSTELQCPVCKCCVPESVHLKNHLKDHYSKKVK